MEEVCRFRWLCFTLLCFGFCRRRDAGACISYANGCVYGYIIFPFPFILYFTLRRIFCLFMMLSFTLFCKRFSLTRNQETSG